MKTSIATPKKQVTSSLFFKIFGWFLAAQLLIGLALYIVAVATQRGFDQRFYEMIGSNLDYRVRAAAAAYESGGDKALRQAWWERSEQNNEGRGGQPQNAGGPGDEAGGGPPPGDMPPDGEERPEGMRGRRMFGRGNELDFAALYIVKGTGPSRYAQRLIGPSMPSSRFQLPMGVVEGETSVLRPTGRSTFLLRRINTAKGSYLGVVRMRFDGGRPPGLFDTFLGNGPGPIAWWRPIVVALMMGALCFALARYLTDPAVKLRHATRQFAAGDFSTRVGTQMGGRRDELADLGRDFDQMAERIENLMVAQRQLLGDISHELRSPLTRLSLALELAEQSADETTKEYLARIQGEVAELNSLIGQLLTLTRLENMTRETSEGSSDAAYIDLSYLLEHVVQNADFEAQNRGGSVKIIENDECQIIGNGELLHSAVENVVRNAILHSGPNPRIEVSLHVQNKNKEGNAVIRIRDYGHGVPAETLDKLFEPFYRVAQARDRQSGGTGLGLSITERAARFHGGTVKATNAEGGGLQVEITLPVKPIEINE